jgi:Flp pilus assembly protein protease CpaA
VTIGGSLFLIIVGAILRFAVTAEVAGVDLKTVGLILMIGGAIGLVLGLAMTFAAQRREPPADGPAGPPAY